MIEDEYVPEVACTGCTFRGDPPYGSAFYDIGNDVSFYMSTTDAWCSTEKRLVQAELLEEPRVYEANLAQAEALANVEDIDLVTGMPMTLESRALKIAEARAILEWSRQRESPAKCLSCSSTDFVPFTLEEEIPHQGCPGNGNLYHAVIRSSCRAGEIPVYNGEGRFLAAATHLVATYGPKLERKLASFERELATAKTERERGKIECSIDALRREIARTKLNG